jgi:hypothetical protein
MTEVARDQDVQRASWSAISFAGIWKMQLPESEPLTMQDLVDTLT